MNPRQVGLDPETRPRFPAQGTERRPVDRFADQFLELRAAYGAMQRAEAATRRSKMVGGTREHDQHAAGFPSERMAFCSNAIHSGVWWSGSQRHVDDERIVHGLHRLLDGLGP